ncbi:MAG: NAD(P)/FAD-dependent oxidoreductase, partial [Candidatus Altiarchaeota archaeon]|nr:NAD(P)/FAD-dependent oxidoreductase [Candidatus Altiarchaeota archaeon]
MDYDVIVIGGGPAGLSAAITSAYYKLNVLVLESASAGGALINQYPWKKVDNYLGVYEKTGLEVSELMSAHAKAEGVRIHENESVEDVKPEKDHIKIISQKTEYTAKAVVLAVGLGSPRKLGVPGEHHPGVMYSLPSP